MSDRITPNLWFDNQAEEAANFYVSIFPNSRITQTARYSEEVSKVAGPPAGSVMMVVYELNGNPFLALNGGPLFQFSEAVSFVVGCKDQAEIDYYWERLSDGGAPGQCGWLKDRFGVSWQVVPDEMGQIMSDPQGSQRAMAALMKMTKLDVAALWRAARGE